jgi:protein-S-isoprenylcysteine O-methyltransferase Ste14
VVVAAFLVLPGLDHRFGWSQVPLPLVVLGHLLVVAGFAVVWAVFRANSFGSSIVEVMPGQRVVDTGPYAVVRHPMYAGGLLLFLGTGLALGSWWGTLLVVPITAGLVARLLHEERFLAERLDGYASYQQRLRWRLVPGLW